MSPNRIRTLLFVAWAIAVFLVAIAVGVATVPTWIAVASVALGPPLVVRHFWRAPEQTMSESIDEARR